MAAGLLWILDAANNTAMEPYRAFIGDKLPESQQTFGFQMQSLFVGAGITLANLSLFFFQKLFGESTQNSAFLHGFIIRSLLVRSVPLHRLAGLCYKTPENPPSEENWQN